MKKYHLMVIGAQLVLEEVIEADYFCSTINNISSLGYYAFYANKEIVACYPIEKTIITKIEQEQTKPGKEEGIDWRFVI
jgi:hypothetical protein